MNNNPYCARNWRSRLVPTGMGALMLTLAACSQEPQVEEAQGYEQPELEARGAELLTVDGYQFKDLNNNGRLDPYEDWRLPTAERVEDLLAQMTREEKVGFMLISSVSMEGGSAFGMRGSDEEVTSNLSEEDVVSETNIFTRQPLPEPMLMFSGTTKGIQERHLRHLILRTNADPRLIAEWANNVQAVAEDTRLGIPAIISSNPRNHVTVDNAMGVGLGDTAFSTWPGELGLAAMRDLELTREFAEIAGREWASVGLRKGYMYMADLATEPRWERVEGTFGESADLAADMIREVTLGFQGESLGKGSVALTTKHFPGGGPQVDGQDPHFLWGQDQHYPGNMFDYHLKPFKAAIEAGTASIMPYYAKPVGTDYEEKAFAYNKQVLTGLLRETMGFEGIINSDTGPIEMMPWGVESLSLPERYRRALDAGVDLFSGTADPTRLLQAVNDGLVSEARLDESVRRLLAEKFDLGLFENPYVDPDYAERSVGSDAHQTRADLALRKSVVLLRNDKSLLPLEPATKVYVERYRDDLRGGDPIEVFAPDSHDWNVEFVSQPDDADVVVFWLSPNNGGLFGSTGDPIDLRLSQNGVDVDRVNQMTKDKPVVMAINFSNPWVINEIDQGSLGTIVATFGTSMDALMDVLDGSFAPTGKLPFTIPSSQQAVESNRSDVPGYLEPEGYALFEFGAGLTY
ncbi:glycoside hydrolase family 3 protein [Marinimicrobium alkaliphilum]|uniref:glycoside hydrolase family 3 protein n=1 Tax=Marinimicrobium alkaliphilum TaxID=2202654 RepID=UPI0018E088E9|nr:glycoside hydrolase family 3 protein [Marinimicrobium alkaliphilum]